MIIYHPAFDLYNCIFRMLQILSFVDGNEVEVDRLRIWDFYLTFPREARKITFPQDLSVLKRTVFKNKEPNPYEDLLDAKKIIERMKSYQLAALKSLASYGFIDKDKLNKNIVKRTDKVIPAELQVELIKLSAERENIIKLVIGFGQLPLFGTNGLKARTGLIEFRYDAN